MPITSVNKTVSPASIEKGGTAQVTLSITAMPSSLADPVNVALVLDRSGSMAGEPLQHLKAGAQQFVRILAENTGAPAGGDIEGGSTAGLVSFAASATIDQPFTANVQALNTAIEALQAAGNSNIASGLGQANALFGTGDQDNRKVLVLFSDGAANLGPDPVAIADNMKLAGVEIYCIGLAGSTGLDEELLNRIASEPTATHVAIAPSVEQLEEIFRNVASNVASPGATMITVDEVVNDNFTIVSIGQPSQGIAQATGTGSLVWNIAKLAPCNEETATLTFEIQAVGGLTGDVLVDQSITLTDAAGESVHFPNPVLHITGGGPGPQPECPVIDIPCPDPVAITASGCEECVCADLGCTSLETSGRILNLSMTLKGLCPGKRVAVGILVSEVDACGNVYDCGFKTLVIPPQRSSTGGFCAPVRVRGMRFVVPDSIPGLPHCAKRTFLVRVFTNTIDFCGCDPCGGSEENNRR